MKLYIVRHGETDWNARKIMQGNTDIPLNENGINQALYVSKLLEDKEIDICYSSPLKRTYETARIICDESINIIKDDRLVERELGEFEGKDTSLYNSKYYWNRKINSSEYGVESANDLISRVNTFYKDLLNKNNNDKKILIVTHGAVVRSLNFIIKGYNDETDFSLFDVPNCHVFEYEIEKKEVI